VLAILTTDTPDTQQELARLLGKAPGIAVIAVDRLQAAGLVERHSDPADRRRSRVVATEAGRKALRKADLLSDDGLSWLLPGLDASQRDSLYGLLARGVNRIPMRNTTKSPSASAVNRPALTSMSALPGGMRVQSMTRQRLVLGRRCGRLAAPAAFPAVAPAGDAGGGSGFTRLR
jgi:DNA-binding MarR family transcriptional regulator